MNVFQLMMLYKVNYPIHDKFMCLIELMGENQFFFVYVKVKNKYQLKFDLFDKI